MEITKEQIEALGYFRDNAGLLGIVKEIPGILANARAVTQNKSSDQGKLELERLNTFFRKVINSHDPKEQEHGIEFQQLISFAVASSAEGNDNIINATIEYLEAETPDALALKRAYVDVPEMGQSQSGTPSPHTTDETGSFRSSSGDRNNRVDALNGGDSIAGRPIQQEQGDGRMSKGKGKGKETVTAAPGRTWTQWAGGLFRGTSADHDGVQRLDSPEGSVDLQPEDSISVTEGDSLITEIHTITPFSGDQTNNIVGQQAGAPALIPGQAGYVAGVAMNFGGQARAEARAESKEDADSPVVEHKDDDPLVSRTGMMGTATGAVALGAPAATVPAPIPAPGRGSFPPPPAKGVRGKPTKPTPVYPSPPALDVTASSELLALEAERNNPVDLNTEIPVLFRNIDISNITKFEEEAGHATTIPQFIAASQALLGAYKGNLEAVTDISTTYVPLLEKQMTQIMGTQDASGSWKKDGLLHRFPEGSDERRRLQRYYDEDTALLDMVTGAVSTANKSCRVQNQLVTKLDGIVPRVKETTSISTSDDEAVRLQSELEAVTKLKQLHKDLAWFEETGNNPNENGVRLFQEERAETARLIAEIKENILERHADFAEVGQARYNENYTTFTYNQDEELQKAQAAVASFPEGVERIKARENSLELMIDRNAAEQEFYKGRKELLEGRIKHLQPLLSIWDQMFETPTTQEKEYKKHFLNVSSDAQERLKVKARTIPSKKQLQQGNITTNHDEHTALWDAENEIIQGAINLIFWGGKLKNLKAALKGITSAGQDEATYKENRQKYTDALKAFGDTKVRVFETLDKEFKERDARLEALMFQPELQEGMYQEYSKQRLKNNILVEMAKGGTIGHELLLTGFDARYDRKRRLAQEQAKADNDLPDKNWLAKKQELRSKEIEEVNAEYKHYETINTHFDQYQRNINQLIATRDINDKEVLTATEKDKYLGFLSGGCNYGVDLNAEVTKRDEALARIGEEAKKDEQRCEVYGKYAHLRDAMDLEVLSISHDIKSRKNVIDALTAHASTSLKADGPSEEWLNARVGERALAKEVVRLEDVWKDTVDTFIVNTTNLFSTADLTVAQRQKFDEDIKNDTKELEQIAADRKARPAHDYDAKDKELKEKHDKHRGVTEAEGRAIDIIDSRNFYTETTDRDTAKSDYEGSSTPDNRKAYRDAEAKLYNLRQKQGEDVKLICSRFITHINGMIAASAHLHKDEQAALGYLAQKDTAEERIKEIEKAEKERTKNHKALMLSLENEGLAAITPDNRVKTAKGNVDRLKNALSLNPVSEAAYQLFAEVINDHLNTDPNKAATEAVGKVRVGADAAVGAALTEWEKKLQGRTSTHDVMLGALEIFIENVPKNVQGTDTKVNKQVVELADNAESLRRYLASVKPPAKEVEGDKALDNLNQEVHPENQNNAEQALQAARIAHVVKELNDWLGADSKNAEIAASLSLGDLADDKVEKAVKKLYGEKGEGLLLNPPTADEAIEAVPLKLDLYVQLKLLQQVRAEKAEGERKALAVVKDDLRTAAENAANKEGARPYEAAETEKKRKEGWADITTDLKTELGKKLKKPKLVLEEDYYYNVTNETQKVLHRRTLGVNTKTLAQMVAMVGIASGGEAPSAEKLAKNTRSYLDRNPQIFGDKQQFRAVDLAVAALGEKAFEGKPAELKQAKHIALCYYVVATTKPVMLTTHNKVWNPLTPNVHAIEDERKLNFMAAALSTVVSPEEMEAIAKDSDQLTLLQSRLFQAAQNDIPGRERAKDLVEGAYNKWKMDRAHPSTVSPPSTAEGQGENKDTSKLTPAELQRKIEKEEDDLKKRKEAYKLEKGTTHKEPSGNRTKLGFALGAIGILLCLAGPVGIVIGLGLMAAGAKLVYNERQAKRAFKQRDGLLDNKSDAIDAKKEEIQQMRLQLLEETQEAERMKQAKELVSGISEEAKAGVDTNELTQNISEELKTRKLTEIAQALHASGVTLKTSPRESALHQLISRQSKPVAAEGRGGPTV